MSNLRHYYLEDLKVLSARTGTYIVNLPEEGWLVALIARLSVENEATDSRFLHPHDGVTKLEVVADGGEVIKSLDGRLCKGLNHLDGIKFPRDIITQGNGMMQEESFYLLFGGSLKDAEWGLDLGKHTNPQFKITWNGALTSVENTTATVAWDAANFPKLTLICVFLEGAPGSPRGFVRTQYVTYTPPAAGTKEVEIPRGKPLRRIVLRNFYQGSDEEKVFDRVKLDINRGGYIPYNLRYDDLIALNGALYDLAHYQARLEYTDGDAEDSHLSWYHALVAITRGGGPFFYRVDSRMGGRLRIVGMTYAGAASGQHPLNYAAEGIGLHHCLALPFDIPGGLAAAYPTAGLADIRLKIESVATASVSGTAYVVWEDIVGY